METTYIRKKYPFPSGWPERKYFIYACFVEDLQSFYRDWVEQGRKIGRHQYFNTRGDGTLEHKYWSPSNRCSESGDLLTPDTIDIKVGYWTPNVWKPVHKDLRAVAMKREAYECQLIDTNCNDCVHLNRGESMCEVKKIRVSVTPNVCNPGNADCFTHLRSVR